MAIKYKTKSEAIEAMELEPNLECVSSKLRDDEDVVIAAIKNGATIYPVSFRLRNSPNIVKLYARNALAPDNDYARVLYSVAIDPAVFYHEPDIDNYHARNYCQYFKKNRQFNIHAKLNNPCFVSAFEEYNSMTAELLESEAKRLKLEEISKVRISYQPVLPKYTLTFKGAQDFPFIHKLISHRVKNAPFSCIRDIVIKEIEKNESEKKRFLSSLQKTDFGDAKIGDYPTPVHDIWVKYLNEWLDAINESLTEADEIPPISAKGLTKGNPSTNKLEFHIGKAIPSSTGLYPHEILLLYDATKLYYLGQQVFPGKWFYQYGISDLPHYLEKLVDQGYMMSGDIKKTLMMQTVPELKTFMKKHNVQTAGGKESLVERILETISEPVIKRSFPTVYYVLTKKGQEELDNNQYLFSPLAANETIWTLNKKYAKAPVKTTADEKAVLKEDYDRNRWLAIAARAKKGKDYLLEIKLNIDILYHDLGQQEDQKTEFMISWTQNNLHFYFPYKQSGLKVAPGIIRDIQLAQKRLFLSEKELDSLICSVVADHDIDIFFFTKDEIKTIIAAEVKNDKDCAARVYDEAFLRIKQHGLNPSVRHRESQSMIRTNDMDLIGLELPALDGFLEKHKFTEEQLKHLTIDSAYGDNIVAPSASELTDALGTVIFADNAWAGDNFLIISKNNGNYIQTMPVDKNHFLVEFHEQLSTNPLDFIQKQAFIDDTNIDDTNSEYISAECMLDLVGTFCTGKYPASKGTKWVEIEI